MTVQPLAPVPASRYRRRMRRYVLVIASMVVLSTNLWDSAVMAGQDGASSNDRARAIVVQMRAVGQEMTDIHLALAAFYARHGDRHRVFRHLQAVRAEHGDPSRIDLVLAILYRREGNYDAAMVSLLSVLGRTERQPYALLQLWKTLYEAQLRATSMRTSIDVVRERLEGAGMHIPAALDVDADAATISARLSRAGYQSLLAGDTRHAQQLFESAIDASPSNALAHRGLGIAREREGDLIRASGAYLLYLELRPDAPDADAVDRVIASSWRTLGP